MYIQKQSLSALFNFQKHPKSDVKYSVFVTIVSTFKPRFKIPRLPLFFSLVSCFLTVLNKQILFNINVNSQLIFSD